MVDLVPQSRTKKHGLLPGSEVPDIVVYFSAGGNEVGIKIGIRHTLSEYLCSLDAETRAAIVCQLIGDIGEELGKEIHRVSHGT